MSAPLDPKVQAVVNAARAVIRARPHFGFSPDGPIGPQAVDALIKLETALYAMPPFYHTLGNGEVWCVRGAAAIEDGERVCVAEIGRAHV